MALMLEDAYKFGPTSEEFGVALLRYVKAIIHQEYGSQFDYLEDAIGQSIIKVLEDIYTYDATLSPLPVWVKIIVCHVCTDMLRNHNHSKTQALVGNESWNPFNNIDRIVLSRLLEKLDSPDRLLIVEKLSGLTEQELANKHDVTQQAIHGHLARIEKKLRTLVGGGHDESHSS